MHARRRPRLFVSGHILLDSDRRLPLRLGMSAVCSDPMRRSGQLTQGDSLYPDIRVFPGYHSPAQVDRPDGVCGRVKVGKPLGSLDVFGVIGMEAGHVGRANPGYLTVSANHVRPV